MKIRQNEFFIGAARFAAVGILALGLPLCVQAQDTNLSFSALQAAADKGDPVAQLELAADYAHGTGVPQDYAKAADYLRRAAEQGNTEAEMALGSYYGRGRGVPKNMGLAIQWYRKAADQGNAVAQFAMGNFYATGRGVINDMLQAIQWWQKAAAQNQIDAQTVLGELFLIPKPPYGTNYLNYAEAVRWLRPAADAGSISAMNNLGVAYENGYGVTSDLAQAAKWYRQAAEMGNANAQANLGLLYMTGQGVPMDLVQAYKWFKLSSIQNSALGTHHCEEMESNQSLKPEQLAQAEQMVRDFLSQQRQKSM